MHKSLHSALPPQRRRCSILHLFLFATFCLAFFAAFTPIQAVSQRPAQVTKLTASLLDGKSALQPAYIIEFDHDLQLRELQGKIVFAAQPSVVAANIFLHHNPPAATASDNLALIPPQTGRRFLLIPAVALPPRSEVNLIISPDSPSKSAATALERMIIRLFPTAAPVFSLHSPTFRCKPAFADPARCDPESVELLFNSHFATTKLRWNNSDLAPFKQEYTTQKTLYDRSSGGPIAYPDDERGFFDAVLLRNLAPNSTYHLDLSQEKQNDIFRRQLTSSRPAIFTTGNYNPSLLITKKTSVIPVHSATDAIVIVRNLDELILKYSTITAAGLRTNATHRLNLRHLPRNTTHQVKLGIPGLLGSSSGLFYGRIETKPSLPDHLRNYSAKQPLIYHFTPYNIFASLAPHRSTAQIIDFATARPVTDAGIRLVRIHQLANIFEEYRRDEQLPLSRIDTAITTLHRPLSLTRQQQSNLNGLVDLPGVADIISHSTSYDIYGGDWLAVEVKKDKNFAILPLAPEFLIRDDFTTTAADAATTSPQRFDFAAALQPPLSSSATTKPSSAAPAAIPHD